MRPIVTLHNQLPSLTTARESLGHGCRRLRVLLSSVQTTALPGAKAVNPTAGLFSHLDTWAHAMILLILSQPNCST